MEQVRWPKGGLNTDDSVEIMNPDDWSYAANIVDGRSYNAKNGEKENIRGTQEGLPRLGFTDDNSKLIGVIRSGKDDIDYLFFYNSVALYNCIVKLQNDVLSLVLQWSGLAFTATDRITGGGIVGDLLYFTDNINPPRCVHVTRYSGGGVPASEEEILHIKRGPQYPPVYFHVPGSANPLEDVQFSFQYEYTDGQLSVLSPWSENIIMFSNYAEAYLPPEEDFPALATRIKMVARRGNAGTPFYVGDFLPPFNTVTPIVYRGQNLGVVDSHYEQSSELVPLLAGSSCIAKSRAWFGNYVEGYDTPAAGSVIITGAVDLTTGQLGIGLAPNSHFRVGVVFSDDQGRSSGVLDCGFFETSNAIKRNAIKQLYTYRITGTPPPWAKHYSFVMTNDTIKSAFYEGWGINNTGSEMYVSVADDGTETYSVSYVSSAQYLRLSMLTMQLAGIFYSFVEGDKVLITNDTTNVTYGPLRVRKITGYYLYVDVISIVDTGAPDFQYNFQIYTPNTSPENIFYEVAQRREIVGGVLDTIDYFYLGDSIGINVNANGSGPDFMLQMRYNPNDGPWNRNIGRGFIKTDIGQVLKPNFIRYSSPFIPGTGVNGLSEFRVGDEGSVPTEAVTIQKLQPTQREGTDGDIILAICNSDTYSVYMDEARLSANDQSFIVSTTNVIGDVRKQRSGFGTLHPESVHEEDGYVYWYDHLQRAYVRYASNGIFPISENKAVDYFEDQALLNDIDDIVITGYDPFYKLIFVTFINAATTTKKTIAFSLTKERWISFFDFAPDGYVTGSKKLYSVVDGWIYPHDNVNATTGFNNFYGTTYDSVISLSFNDAPDKPKEWRVLQIQLSPNFYAFGAGAEQLLVANSLEVDISNRQGQATDIRYNEFDLDENMVYGEIRGDANATGGIVNGDPIYSNTMQCQLTFSGGTYKQILMVKAGCDISRGHNL